MKRLERDIACIAGGAAAGILATGLAAIFVSRQRAASAAPVVTVPGASLKGLGCVGCIPGTSLGGLPGAMLMGLPGVNLGARTKQTARFHWTRNR